jgi:transcriptional regulator with XRE-family HTH domain
MIGDTIKRIRQASGLNQTEFAEAIKCEQSFISKLERGKLTPSYAMAAKLLKFAKVHKVKVKIEDLFILE